MTQKALKTRDMEVQGAFSPEMRVLMNHIYEYQKGVRRMVIFTCKKRFEKFALQRLENQGIDCIAKPVANENVNIYFGRRECMDAIRMMVTRPLNELSPEEDFILGALLGYDLCAQCERYCSRKRHHSSSITILPFVSVTASNIFTDALENGFCTRM